MIEYRYTLNTVTITRCTVRPAYTAVHSRSGNTNRQNPSHVFRHDAVHLRSGSVWAGRMV